MFLRYVRPRRCCDSITNIDFHEVSYKSHLNNKWEYPSNYYINVFNVITIVYIIKDFNRVKTC